MTLDDALALIAVLQEHRAREQDPRARQEEHRARQEAAIRALREQVTTLRERVAERRARHLTRCSRPQPAHPARALAAWLHRHEDERFTVLRIPGVESTNNQAARAIRPFVISREISGGSRSPHGSAIRCDPASVFLTPTARGLNPLTTCLAALQTPTPQL